MNELGIGAGSPFEFGSGSVDRSKTLVIGFGYEAKQGKDTLVNHLIEEFGGEEMQPDGRWRKHFPINMKRYAFADPLKVEVFDYIQAASFFAVQGGRWEKDFPDHNRIYTYQEKLDFINLHKDELRPPLQLWGTEYRRTQDPLYWINQSNARVALDNPRIALFSDMRFLNEGDFCDVRVRVVRTGYRDETAAGHASEQEGDQIKYDYLIEASSVGELKESGNILFEEILRDRGLLPTTKPLVAGFPVWK